ncbi:MAG: EAL domain-containing protein [Rhizobiaceae bacterium]
MADFINLLLSMDATVLAILGGVCLCLLLTGALLRYRRLYRRASKQEQNYATLVENLSEGIYRSRPDGRQISANRALVKLNGYETEKELLAAVKDIGGEWYVKPTRRQEFRELLQRHGRVEDFVSEVYRHKTRERIWISESARLVRDSKGNPLFYEGSVREITDTVRRLAAEAQLQRLSNQLPGALFQFTMDAGQIKEFHYLSAGATSIAGVTGAEMSANPQLFVAMVAEDDRPAYMKSLNAAAESLLAWDHEFRIIARDGAEKWVHLLAHPELVPAGIKWHGYLADISVRKRQELEIEELAFFDPLTRLPNRRRFFQRMSESLARCAERKEYGALLFIDLDNFKTLNDARGHDVGDRYLIEVAARLLDCVGPNDMVARIGGDEFVVILEDAGSSAAEMKRNAIVIANRALAALRKEFTLGELHHVSSASIGILAFDGEERRVEQLLKCADIAMYQAKSAGRNGTALFDPKAMERELESYQLLNELRAALGARQLELHFQPQFDHNRKLTGAEALIRWNHPGRGPVGPDIIMPLVSRYGLGSELATFVLDRGLETLSGWQAVPECAHLRLALNMNLQTIGSQDFIKDLGKRLDGVGFDPRKLTFELVEHIDAGDQQRTATLMQQIKSFGIRLSLDDFGTGYSSLTYLKNLPFDEVKIDGSFVADIEKADADRALVKTMLSLGSNLGRIVVAEHVENVRQEAYLRAFGCDFFQGFLYSKPMRDEDFRAFAKATGTPSSKALNLAAPQAS